METRCTIQLCSVYVIPTRKASSRVSAKDAVTRQEERGRRCVDNERNELVRCINSARITFA